MKVTDISKNEKDQVEFSGDEGTYLIGDIEKMEKGGAVKGRNNKTGESFGVVIGSKDFTDDDKDRILSLIHI